MLKAAEELKEYKEDTDKMTDNVYVIGACRTAVVRFRNTERVTAVELGTHMLKEAIKERGFHPDQIDQVIPWQRTAGRAGTESGKAGDCQRGTAD